MKGSLSKLFFHSFKREFFSLRSIFVSLFLLLVIGSAVIPNLLQIEWWRGRETTTPFILVELGSAQAQSFAATCELARQQLAWSLPQTVRNMVRIMAFLIPLIALLLSYRSVSSDLESGLALSIYTLPVRKTDLIWAKLLVNMAIFSLSTLIVMVVFSVGMASYGAFAGVQRTEIFRVGIYGISLGVYMLIFLLAGSLISTLSRRSSVALIASLTVILALTGATVIRDGISAAGHPGYPEVPEMSPIVSRVFSSRRVRPEDEATPEMIAYMADLHSYNVDFYNRIRSRYRIERFLNFLSPANLHIEVASALLQDRFIPPYQIFAPVRLDETHATIGQSLRYLLPEILFTLVMIMLLFWLNVRALTKLEV